MFTRPERYTHSWSNYCSEKLEGPTATVQRFLFRYELESLENFRGVTDKSCGQHELSMVRYVEVSLSLENPDWLSPSNATSSLPNFEGQACLLCFSFCLV